MKEKICFVSILAVMLMLCHNLHAQSTVEVIAEKITSYYDSRQYKYTIADEKLWYGYCQRQIGKKEASVINGLKAYSDKLSAGSMVDMRLSGDVEWAVTRYYAIKGYIKDTDPDKDNIETAWLSLEKKLHAFYSAKLEYEYAGGGSMVTLEFASCAIGLQECHRALWDGMDKAASGGAAANKALAKIDAGIARTMRTVKTSKMRAAGTALKTEIHKYVATLGSDCPSAHLRRLQEFIDDINNPEE